MSLLRKIRATGRVAEPALPAPPARCVDAGSCNGCEIEIGNAFGPVHDVERHGPRLVASPRHADVALVTGR